MILLAINKIDGLNLFIRCLKICGFGLVLLVHGRSLTILSNENHLGGKCLSLAISDAIFNFDILTVIMCSPVKTEYLSSTCGNVSFKFYSSFW